MNNERVEKTSTKFSDVPEFVKNGGEQLANPASRGAFAGSGAPDSMPKLGFPSGNFLQGADQQSGSNSTVKVDSLSADAKKASEYSEGEHKITKKVLDDLHSNGKLDFSVDNDPNETPKDREDGLRDAKQIEELRRNWDTPEAKSLQSTDKDGERSINVPHESAQ